MGGIGKSTLAAQIATQVSRLQSGRIVIVVNGEVSATAPWPAETDFVILDNFDDNLTQDSGRWTVRDPELAARLAANEPVWVGSFGGRGPGESPGLALRTAEITAPEATARRMLAIVRAQRSPYLASRADLIPGPDGYVLTIEFGAPTPLGMLR